MGMLANIRHWFDKRSAVMTVAETTLEQMTKFNALVRSDPEDIIRAIDEFNCGYLAPMARLIGDYEQRDDKMRVSSIKMASAVSRCGWSVRPKKGFEDAPDAARQVEVLERFWSTVRVTDAFKRNERGGLALLKEQMMSAQSYGFAVHDLSWKPLANGEIEATFTSVPLWKFENRTGELRYIPQVGGWDGVEMKRGEWMVSTGDGIGIAAAICACMKRLGLTNWLVFTDRCVLPLIHGKTGAAYGSEQWNNLQKALKNINRLARVVTDPSTDINAIQMDGGKQNPFGPLIDWCDRAIVTLYRGGDLGTISRPDAVGGLGQLDEVDALEQRSCVRITETLNEQVSSFVVDYVLNQALKAEIVVEPVSKPDVKQDMEIDNHLAKYGVKLSKTDALARYGRAEAAEDDPGDAMELKTGPETGLPGGFRGLANERQPQTALQTNEKPLQNAPRVLDGQGDPSGQPPAQIAKNRPSAQSAVIDAFMRQNSEAAKAVKAVVDNPSEGAFAQLMANLPGLLPTDPALAAVIADEMAKTYGAASVSSRQSLPSRDNLANSECHADNPATCRVHGTPREHRDKGFQDRYGNGNPETLAANPEMNIERGKAVFTRLARKQTGDEPHAMYREGLGWIGVEAGTAGNPRPYDGPNKNLKGRTFLGGSGIAHILAKHPGAERHIAETLQHGEMFRNLDNATGKPNERKITIIHGNNVAIVSKHRDGRLLITNFFEDNPEKIEALKALGPYHVRGENK